MSDRDEDVLASEIDEALHPPNAPDVLAPIGQGILYRFLHHLMSPADEQQVINALHGYNSLCALLLELAEKDRTTSDGCQLCPLDIADEARARLAAIREGR